MNAKIAVLAGVQANVYTLSYNCDVIARELQYICKRVVFTLWVFLFEEAQSESSSSRKHKVSLPLWGSSKWNARLYRLINLSATVRELYDCCNSLWFYCVGECQSTVLQLKKSCRSLYECENRGVSKLQESCMITVWTRDVRVSGSFTLWVFLFEEAHSESSSSRKLIVKHAIVSLNQSLCNCKMVVWTTVWTRNSRCK